LFISTYNYKAEHNALHPFSTSSQRKNPFNYVSVPSTFDTMDVTPTPERVASSTDTASRLGSPEPTLKRPAPFADDQEIADVLIEKKRKL